MFHFSLGAVAQHGKIWGDWLFTNIVSFLFQSKAFRYCVSNISYTYFFVDPGIFKNCFDCCVDQFNSLKGENSADGILGSNNHLRSHDYGPISSKILPYIKYPRPLFNALGHFRIDSEKWEKLHKTRTEPI